RGAVAEALADGAGLAVVLRPKRGDLRQRAALVEQHRHPAGIHRQRAPGGAAQRRESRWLPVEFARPESALVGVAPAVTARDIRVVVTIVVAVVALVREALAARVAPPRTVFIVVVLVVVVVHRRHTEVRLDLVQCAHRWTLLEELLPVMKM